MKGFFGGILFGCGILIAGLSGLCSGLLLITSVLGGEDATMVVPMTLLFGGIPFAVGIGLFFLGRSVMRSAAHEPSAPAAGPAGPIVPATPVNPAPDGEEQSDKEP